MGVQLEAERRATHAAWSRRLQLHASIGRLAAAAAAAAAVGRQRRAIIIISRQQQQQHATCLEPHRRVLQPQPLLRRLLLLLPLQQAGHRKGALPRQLLAIQLQQLVPLLQASRLCRRAADQAQHPHALPAGCAARLTPLRQRQALQARCAWVEEGSHPQLCQLDASQAACLAPLHATSCSPSWLQTLLLCPGSAPRRSHRTCMAGRAAAMRAICRPPVGTMQRKATPSRPSRQGNIGHHRRCALT